jgi:hypothetical protein
MESLLLFAILSYYFFYWFMACVLAEIEHDIQVANFLNREEHHDQVVLQEIWPYNRRRLKAKRLPTIDWRKHGF